ncbi:MAG: glycosyltransferase [Candidatus Hodarchaeota archaeon]
MKVVNVYHNLNPEHGGPARTIPKLCRNLAAQSCSCSILTLKLDLNGCSDLAEGVNIIQRDTLWSALIALKSLICSQGQTVDIIHLNVAWVPLSWLCFKIAKYYKVKIIVSPRGSLDPWSLKYNLIKRIKKKTAWFIYARRIYEGASCIHVTSDDEMKYVRGLNLKVPICIVPNGIDVEEFSKVPDKRIINEIFSTVSEKRILLFMSRIHPKKGLINLAYSWKHIASKFPNWCLIIAGPDEQGHLAEVKATIGETDRVHFFGQVLGEKRIALYHAAELFALPTFDENFGLVVAEALAAGVPVITTKGAPWQELEKNKCGWWIDIGSEPLEATLKKALSLKSDKLAAMGRRGQDLVAKKYTWSQIATDMMSVYNWLLGKNPCPSCVKK